jgi:hypothetical protein
MNTSPKLDDQAIQYIITNYNHRNSSELSKKFNVQLSTIVHHLKKNNVYIKVMPKLNNNDKINIINDYKRGIDVLKLSKQYDIAVQNVHRLLKLNNIKIRNSRNKNGRLYDLNENYFRSIKNSDVAYIIGLIITDGNVMIRYNGCYLSITLHINDKYILEEISKKLSYNGPLYIYKNRNACALKICSKILCDDLKKYCIVPNKSLTVKFPDINKYFYHFLRGVIDGDGSIMMSQKRNRPAIVIYSGSFNFTNGLYKKLCKLKMEPVFQKVNDRAYRIIIGKRKPIVKLLKLLYKNANMFLIRKKEMANKIIDQF